jgi:hypothetical protein
MNQELKRASSSVTNVVNRWAFATPVSRSKVSMTQEAPMSPRGANRSTSSRSSA